MKLSKSAIRARVKHDLPITFSEERISAHGGLARAHGGGGGAPSGNLASVSGGSVTNPTTPAPATRSRISPNSSRIIGSKSRQRRLTGFQWFSQRRILSAWKQRRSFRDHSHRIQFRRHDRPDGLPPCHGLYPTRAWPDWNERWPAKGWVRSLRPSKARANSAISLAAAALRLVACPPIPYPVFKPIRLIRGVIR